MLKSSYRGVRQSSASSKRQLWRVCCEADTDSGALFIAFLSFCKICNFSVLGSEIRSPWVLNVELNVIFYMNAK